MCVVVRALVLLQSVSNAYSMFTSVAALAVLSLSSVLTSAAQDRMDVRILSSHQEQVSMPHMYALLAPSWVDAPTVLRTAVPPTVGIAQRPACAPTPCPQSHIHPPNHLPALPRAGQVAPHNLLAAVRSRRGRAACAADLRLSRRAARRLPRSGLPAAPRNHQPCCVSQPRRASGAASGGATRRPRNRRLAVRRKGRAVGSGGRRPWPAAASRSARSYPRAKRAEGVALS
jgi:hypothetical protein